MPINSKSNQPLPPFRGVFSQAEIDAINAEIAAGSMFYASGETLMRSSDNAVLTLRGTGTAASFQVAPPIVVSASAPSNGDGRPDGTIYIQTV